MVNENWNALHQELTSGLKAGKYKKVSDFLKERGIRDNTLRYNCDRLGLDTHFSKYIKPGKRSTKPGRNPGKFIHFAPVSEQKLEVVIDGHIRVLVPRGDMESLRMIRDTFSNKEAA